MELVHAKMERGEGLHGDAAYQATFVFGSPFTDEKGNHIGKAKPIHMSFLNGMPPEAFVVGLRALADHVEEEFKEADNKPNLTVVEDDKSG